VEITNGTDTAVLETMDHSEAQWVKKQIGLKGRIPFTSTMQLRFKATSMGTNQNIVYAAIDEVKVEEFDCAQSPCTHPEVMLNSMKATKTDANTALFAWRSPDTGEWNVHRTSTKGNISTLWQDGTTLQTSVPVPQYSETGWPAPGTVYFYQVYGRDSCTGNSMP
jgi:hypothetical protein